MPDFFRILLVSTVSQVFARSVLLLVLARPFRLCRDLLVASASSDRVKKVSLFFSVAPSSPWALLVHDSGVLARDCPSSSTNTISTFPITTHSC